MKKTLQEISDDGKRCTRFTDSEADQRGLQEFIASEHLRTDAPSLPQVTEQEIARHFARLAADNYNLDAGFYPLGSCTMKYNPKAMQMAARAEEWTALHPEAAAETVQGALQVMWELEQWLATIGGMSAASLQPPAGAAGEFTCLRMFRAWHDACGHTNRNRVIVPDTAHGTNPASVARCGYDPTVVESGDDGRIDLEELEAALGDDVAALMLTNPNTLGLFETDVREIAKMVHDAGALLYNDGANMNAMLTFGRPGEMGFDAMHFNLHKTFATPHGGGGPGSGPVAVKEHLEPFLPTPRIEHEKGSFAWDWDQPQSIGSLHAFYGNFGVVVQAYTYILALGAEGLRKVSETAVLNANYILEALKEDFDLPFSGPCMHECVLSAETLAEETGVTTADIAKRLLDYGLHPPTVYFPLIVKEALMIEPTETEPKRMLDRFIEAIRAIVAEAASDPDTVHNAPHATPVRRLDETQAARNPRLRW